MLKIFVFEMSRRVSELKHFSHQIFYFNKQCVAKIISHVCNMTHHDIEIGNSIYMAIKKILSSDVYINTLYLLPCMLTVVTCIPLSEYF